VRDEPVLRAHIPQPRKRGNAVRFAWGRRHRSCGGSHRAIVSHRRPHAWPTRGTAQVRALMYLVSYVTALVHSRRGSCAAGPGGREPADDAGDLDRRSGHRG
jgi:hypothetical protein